MIDSLYLLFSKRKIYEIFRRETKRVRIMVNLGCFCKFFL